MAAYKQLSTEESTNVKDLVIAIADFLLKDSSEKLNPSTTHHLQVAVTCLEKVYSIQLWDYFRLRHTSGLPEIFRRASRPVSIRDRQQAEKFKMDGNTCMKRGKYSSAEVHYTRAISLDRWNAVYFCDRAAARIRLSQYMDAVLDCNRALKLDSRYAKAYGRLGQAFCLMNRPEKASRCYKKALSIEPSNAAYLRSLDLVVKLKMKAGVFTPLGRLKKNFARLASNFPLLKSSQGYQSLEENLTTQEKRLSILEYSEPVD